MDGEILEIQKHYCHYLCECGNEFHIYTETYAPGGTKCDECKKIFVFKITFEVSKSAGS